MAFVFLHGIDDMLHEEVNPCLTAEILNDIGRDMNDVVHFVGIIEKAALCGKQGSCLQDVHEACSLGVVVQGFPVLDLCQLQIMVDHARAFLPREE